MRIRFTPSHDGETWPSLLGEREAAFGEASYGPLGLLGFLETCTGLSGPRPSRTERIARWLPALRREDGFYSASLEQDPVGTARVLLSWRDELALQGWEGEVTKGRLADLAGVDALVANGIGDRLRAVRARLGRESSGIELLELSEAEATLPSEWGKVLAALREAGTEIRELPPASAEGRAKYKLFRPHGPRNGADELAAWLAHQGEFSGTVIIAGDSLLDLALRRHGLPCTGAVESAPGWGFQLLALTLATAFWPADPKRVQELLSLRPNPLPDSLCKRLLRALADYAGVGNPAWNAALEKGLEALSEDHDRQAVRVRAEALFPNPGPSAEPVAELSAAELTARIDLLDDWIRNQDELDLAETSGVNQVMRAVLTHNAEQGWDLLRLSRWLAEIGSSCQRATSYQAEAGLIRVDTPAAILGPAKRILWWSFVRGPSDREADIPWTEEERSALRAAGIPWPSAALRAQRRAAHWQRPPTHAQELILVAPMYGEDGEERHPHPLYDELIGCDGDAAPREIRGLVYRERSPELLPLAVASDRFRLPDRELQVRDAESANSLQTLISCPFAYAMEYQRRLRPGALRHLASGSRLLGSFAHALFADLLDPERRSERHAGEGKPKKLSAELKARFHQLAPRLLAELYQPGGALELRRQEQILARAYEELRPLLARAGMHVVACEKEYSTEDKRAPGGRLAGRLDMVIGPELAVLDLKGGKTRYLIEALEEDRAVQLAVYARLLMTPKEAEDFTKPWPKAAYFMIGDLQSLCAEPFLGVDAIEGANPRRTFLAACRSAREVWQGLSVDRIAAAPGLNSEGLVIDFSRQSKSERIPRGIDAEGSLHLDPGCRFCDYSGLCGHSLEAAQA